MVIKIKVKCVICGKEKEVDEKQKDMPFCDDDGGPMIAESATLKT